MRPSRIESQSKMRTKIILMPQWTRAVTIQDITELQLREGKEDIYTSKANGTKLYLGAHAVETVAMQMLLPFAAISLLALQSEYGLAVRAAGYANLTMVKLHNYTKRIIKRFSLPNSSGEC